MMTMREKIARAIFDRYASHAMPLGNPEWNQQEEYRQQQFFGLVDAALDALMEPTEAMIKAGINDRSGSATARAVLHETEGG